jgi:hypothetical protein
MSDIRSITYRGGVAVTKSDTVNDPGGPFAGFYVGGAGDVSMLCIDGTSITFTATLAGRLYPIAIKRVNSTSTTATAIVGLKAPSEVL